MQFKIKKSILVNISISKITICFKLRSLPFSMFYVKKIVKDFIQIILCNSQVFHFIKKMKILMQFYLQYFRKVKPPLRDNKT